MDSITVSVLGATKEIRQEVASALGRKGSESDMTFFNNKRSKITTIIEPTRFPEKIQPFCYSLNMADHILIVYDGMKPAFGESLIAAESLQKPATFIIKKENEYMKDELKKVLLETTYSDSEILVYSKPSELIEFVDGIEHKSTGTLKVHVDSAFDVKGIGTVVLGFVHGGTIEKHQKMVVARTNQSCIIKSIQMQDDDYDSASSGSRVGLALRGISSDNLRRGDILSDSELKRKDMLSELKTSKFYKSEPNNVHISSGFQFIPGNVEGVSVVLESDIFGSERVLVLDLNSKQRVVGTAI